MKDFSNQHGISLPISMTTLNLKPATRTRRRINRNRKMTRNRRKPLDQDNLGDYHSVDLYFIATVIKNGDRFG